MQYEKVELINNYDSFTGLLVHMNDSSIPIDSKLCVDLQYHICCCGWAVNVTKLSDHLMYIHINGGIGFNGDEVGFFTTYLYKEVKSFIDANVNGMAVEKGVYINDLNETPLEELRVVPCFRRTETKADTIHF